MSNSGGSGSGLSQLLKNDTSFLKTADKSRVIPSGVDSDNQSFARMHTPERRTNAAYSGSISGRLKNASFAEKEGLIDAYQKGLIKVRDFVMQRFRK